VGDEQSGDTAAPLPPDASVAVTVASDNHVAGVGPITESESVLENPAPMLDVHAPHQTVHTWKDFFIHMAAISVGLLIAIGLEQTVEYAHRLHQLDKARRELTTELEDNRKQLEKNLAAAQQIKAQLDRNMGLLRAFQSAHKPIGRQLVYDARVFWPVDGPWQVVKQNGSLGLMPSAELYRYTYIHEGIAAVMDALTELAARMSVASAIAKRAPEADFTPRDVEDLITATSEVQGRLEFVTSLLQLEKIGLNREWR
jgi:hypothetical protein